MQRKISKKVSDALRSQEQDRYRRQQQIPQLPYQQQIRSGPSYGYTHQPEPEVEANQQEVAAPYLSQPSVRNYNQGGSRDEATVKKNFHDFQQSSHISDNVQPPSSEWNDPTIQDVSLSSSLDDLSDDVSWNEPEEVEQEGLGLNFFNQASYEDNDYNVDSSSIDPPRIKSRSEPTKVKSKKSSVTFFPTKKLSKSKSITFQGSDIYSESGPSSGRTSGTSYDSSSFDDRRSSSSSRKGSSSQASLRHTTDKINESVSINNLRKHQKDLNSNQSQKHSAAKVSSGAHLRSSFSRHGKGSGSNSSSFHDVMALPIEIPDSVNDEEAFRRYLSVRRAAIDMDSSRTLQSFENKRSEPSIKSVGLLSSSAIPGRAQNLNYFCQTTHRRTMALSQAIMTLALLSASASQLRFVVAYSNAQSYPALNYFLICTCIFVEIFVGVVYVVLSRFDFTDVFVEKVHSFLIFGLFLVAVANVIIASFALDDHVCETNIKPQELYDKLEQPPPQNPH